MSWSLSHPSLEGVPAEEARVIVRDLVGLPDSVRDYTCAGIDALLKLHGSNVRVKVSGYGHLATGGTNDHSTTSATIEVKLAE